MKLGELQAALLNHRCTDSLPPFVASASSLAHIIDVVEMLAQAYEYEKTGQRKLDEFWRWVSDCQSDEPLRSLANTILRRRNFLRTRPTATFQEFEARHHYRGAEFAANHTRRDSRGYSKRDVIVREETLKHFGANSKRLEVLDVGCGLGSFSKALLESEEITAGVTGFDINPFLLEKARDRWKNKPFSAPGPVDIGWFWDIPTRSCDVVLIGEVLEHVFDPWFVLMEAFRVLKEGGRLLVSVPNSWHKEKIDRFNRLQRIELRYKEEHIRYYSPKSLLDLMRETGFRSEALFGLSPDWTQSHRLDAHGEINEDLAKEVAWTLVASARKCSVEELEAVGVVQGPSRDSEEAPLKDKVDLHESERTWSAIHDFVEEANKAKLMRVDLTDSRSETIAHQTVRNAGLAWSLCVVFGLRANLAIRAALLQGIIEAHISEATLQLRAMIGVEGRRQALDEVLLKLPKEKRERYVAEFNSLLIGSEEGVIVRRLLSRDYARFGYQLAASYAPIGIDDRFNENLADLVTNEAKR